MRSLWLTARSNRVAQLGLFIILSTLAVIVLVRLLSPYGPSGKDYMNILRSPSLSHPFGTDSFGQDVLTLRGLRRTGFVDDQFRRVGTGGLVGTVIGMISGFWNGLLDAVAMRFIDLLVSFPTYVIALCLMLLLGYGGRSVSLVIALIYVPNFARLSRGMTAATRNENYVTAARLMGQSPMRILLREILPNIAAPLLVQFSAGLGLASSWKPASAFSDSASNRRPPHWAS